MCPYFRGCYCIYIVYRLQLSWEYEEVSLSLREGVAYRLQWSWGSEDVSLSERVLHTGFNGVGINNTCTRAVYVHIPKCIPL